MRFIRDHSALVLGVNGQDGSFLAEGLLARGYRVTGIGRQPQSRYLHTSDRFRYKQVDLEDLGALSAALANCDADVAFHAVAVHGPAGHVYEPLWRSMTAVNVLTLHVLLEHARLRRQDLRIVYANSAKVFPSPLHGTIDETSPQTGTCLYSIGKIAARDLIAHYRNQHGIVAGNLFLFNHESARRSQDYFVPKLVRALANARRDQNACTTFKTLNFRADWSDAAELMDIAIDIAERAPGRDFVVASGTTWHGRELVDAVFRRYGLDYRNHIRAENDSHEVVPNFRASSERLEAATGRRPSRDLFSTIHDMLEAEERAPSFTDMVRFPTENAAWENLNSSSV
jgi:GDPmannose 4,6-dehydratase